MPCCAVGRRVADLAGLNLARCIGRSNAEDVVAGVAWAQGRGIRAVEVRVDDGPWEPARLATAVGDDTWRQWVFEWDATPGSHGLQARATDGTGRLQVEERERPIPEGATGWHTVQVTVS